MKKITSFFIAAFVIMVTFSSCQLIGDIFKAGIWTGVLIVAAVVGVIIYLISSIGKRK